MGKARAKAEFVLDSSVTVAWFFEDEADPYAEAIEDTLTSAIAVVPSLWPLEVANALLVGERRNRTTEAKVRQFLELLKSLPILFDDETVTRAWQESLALARVHHLSVYDAVYVELAMRRGLALATLDSRLRAAASAIGVGEYKP